MRPKLIIIEGLPGAGKSTLARLAGEILDGMGLKARLFLEGDVDHPADYEGTACFSEAEFEELLLAATEEERVVLQHWAFSRGEYRFLPYGKIEREQGGLLSSKLRQIAAGKDVYELPLPYNRQVIAEKWQEFSERAQTGDDIYIFECCFIQNPVTVGMVRSGASAAEVQDYIEELADLIKPLHPLLIYIGQADMEFTFRKALSERPREWSEGFIQYYTGQGYGREHGYTGVDGTIKVLEARAGLEDEIVKRLTLDKVRLDNSGYDLDAAEQELIRIVQSRYGTG